MTTEYVKQCLLLAFGCLFPAIAWSTAAVIAAEPAPLTIRSIQQFQPGSPNSRFGALEFVAGLEYASADSRVGGVSAIRFRPNGRDFLAVLDTGNWLCGTVERNEEGNIAGLLGLSVIPMTGGSGQSASKFDMDAEGLVLRGEQIIVSYERRHRIDFYHDPCVSGSRPQSIDMVIPLHELRSNGGIEMLAVSPVDSALQGAVVAIAEKSLDENGNLFASILGGPEKGIFKVVRDEPWAVTDGAFLPQGDLLLLERRFSLLGGLGMRIRRVETKKIRRGALVDGEVLLEVGMEAEIDNMEGLDVVSGSDGEIRIIVVSDNNRSFLQRNLMLEFRLVE